MALTLITTQEVTRAGLAATYVAANATGGNNFVNDGRTELEIVTTGTATNVTIAAGVGMSAGVDGQTLPGRVVACGTTARTKIGPFPPNYYNGADGTVTVTFTAVTGVTIGAFRVPGS
jgi:hypothetical protein